MFCCVLCVVDCFLVFVVSLMLILLSVQCNGFALQCSVMLKEAALNVS